MQQASALWVSAASLLWLGTSACSPNYVQPGFYERIENETAPQPDAAGSRPSNAGVGAVPTSPVSGSLSPSVTGAAGMLAAVSGAPVSPEAVGGGANSPPSSSANPCDLTGRWLITNKLVVDGLGQLQTVHAWSYYELKQTGDQITVTRGLQCGEEIIAGSELGANADSSPSRPAVLKNNSDTGRTGSSTLTNGACMVQFAKWYTPKGATVSYYGDPSNPLPAAEQPATGSTPGWEDWDEDGKPGFTVTVSGIITGKVFMCTRAWHVFSGMVADTSQSFTLADNWQQEQAVLGYEGSDLLTTQAVRAANPSLHFAEFARVTETQVSGDDAAICEGVRQLAAQLTPKASTP